ncbi:ZNF423 [Cordylochernes scorpioides]|uniref:ZNF423 n=1 Tax=Cordylochernes scorpioides TaxID=51811 RepID=A0ABY6LRG9_9ARAC|nr:ZNF423 [Cordylochernes scorpioides]
MNNICEGLNRTPPSSWRSDTPDSSNTLSDSGGDSVTPGDAAPYACSYCDKSFPRLNSLKTHEQVAFLPSIPSYPHQTYHIQPGNDSFEHSLSSESVSSLPRKYDIAVHADQLPFQCSHCRRYFKHKRSRDRHLKIHTGDKRYQCEHCMSKFSRSDHLKIHMKTHDNAKPYQCTDCNRGYSTAAALTSHKQNHKKEDASPPITGAKRCPHCPLTFPNSRELQEHVATAHADGARSPNDTKVVACHFCPQVYQTPDLLKEHVEKSHLAETKGQCPICKETFPTLESLTQHKKIHKDGVPILPTRSFAKFNCYYCKSSDFSSYEALQLHIQTVHFAMLFARSPSMMFLAETGGTYECEYCGSKFNNVHLLQNHIIAAHHLGNYLKKDTYCMICNTVFPSGSAFNDHMALHESARPAKDLRSHPAVNGQLKESKHDILNGFAPQSAPMLCNQCHAPFPDFESFRTHLQTHLDATIQKFTCTECDKEFTTQDSLDHHTLTHFLALSTEYGCQYCSKYFEKAEELQKHLLDVHTSHMFKCTLCKEAFDSKFGIQAHFAAKHNSECRLLKCTSCGVPYRTEADFKMHVRLVHLCKLLPYRCFLCEQGFANETQLQYHHYSHQKQYPCKFCDEAFHVEFLLDRHLQTNHAKETTISSTDNGFPSTNDVAQNLSLKSRSRNEEQQSDSRTNYKCDICDNLFPSESSLNTHRRQAHNIKNASQKNNPTALSLSCAYCHETFKSRTELESHMKVHTVSSSKHKCNICDEILPSATLLSEHKLTHCKVVTGNTCAFCKQTLATKEQFLSHLQEHNTGPTTSCVICRQTLVTDSDTLVHAKFHLTIREVVATCCVCTNSFEPSHLIITGRQENGQHTYMCKECFHSKSKDLEGTADLSRDSECRGSTPNSLHCIKCQLSFKTEDDFKNHVETHMNGDSADGECKLCHKVLESSAKLQLHLIEHNFEGCNSFTCYLCSSVFTTSRLLHQHMLEHGLNTRPYDCSHCHQKFFFRAELDNHSFVHSDHPSKPEQYKCNECNQSFPCLAQLEQHHQAHGLHYRCTQCPMIFSSGAEMQHHHFQNHGPMEVEEDKKSFSCPSCDSTFTVMDELQEHLRIHVADTQCPICHKTSNSYKNHGSKILNGDTLPHPCYSCSKKLAHKAKKNSKPYMCPHCGKIFSKRCHVKEHMRTHVSSTVSPCELCKETFPSNRLLRQHLKEIHQQTYNYTCPICQDIFKRSKSLDTHLVKRHDVLTVNVEDCDMNEEQVSDASSSEMSSYSSDHKDYGSSDCSSIADDLKDSLASPQSHTEESSINISET